MADPRILGEVIRGLSAQARNRLEELHTYDFGTSWQHEITLKEVRAQHPLAHPECPTGKGDNPVEYYNPDEPQAPEPLDVGTVNERLRRLAWV